jgi:hypothetical protein
MEPPVITSFSLGLIFGGIVTAAVSINERNRLRELILSLKSSEEEQIEIIENSEK